MVYDPYDATAIWKEIMDMTLDEFQDMKKKEQERFILAAIKALTHLEIDPELLPE